MHHPVGFVWADFVTDCHTNLIGAASGRNEADRILNYDRSGTKGSFGLVRCRCSICTSRCCGRRSVGQLSAWTSPAAQRLAEKAIAATVRIEHIVMHDETKPSRVLIHFAELLDDRSSLPLAQVFRVETKAGALASRMV